MKYIVMNNTTATVYIANILQHMKKGGKVLKKIINSTLDIIEPEKDDVTEVHAINQEERYEVELEAGTLIDFNADKLVDFFTFNARYDDTLVIIEIADIKPGTN